MSILYDASTKIFNLHTPNTTYQMKMDRHGHLLHLYYGRRIANDRMDNRYLPADYGFSPVFYPDRYTRIGFSPDILPFEYTSVNTGDFRLSCLECTTEDGIYGAQLLITGYEIIPGKYGLETMPTSYASDEEADTLLITLRDDLTGLEVELRFGVFRNQDIITRTAVLKNTSDKPIKVTKASSACLDLPFGKWDMIHFHGRHTMERKPERVHLQRAVQTIGSKRGSSSHQHNPFVVLCEQEANEQYGACYGVMLMYSGNHTTEIEVDQLGLTRVVTGISQEQFDWKLDVGETFESPEVLLSFTSNGLAELSRNYHKLIRNNVCRGEWQYKRRPVLVNSWEASYFNFTGDTLVRLAKDSVDLGIEMLVLDDGWFGSRNDDNAGLGDWKVNEEKLQGGLGNVISQVNALGMKFGIWIEPEMVNEDSDLYRTHPEWALRVPGRAPAMGRNQLVLDLANKDVVDYLYDSFYALLSENNIEYVKWDMNRNMADVYSHALPADRQGEVFHRYILGVYDLAKRLNTAFPHVLFEGCSGGGGRFDAAMMAYFPQIWCSDNTDAIERLTIQYGTSFGYPVSVVGAHVSACPNHQTGRTTPLGTRGVVAMSGTFGYEMNLGAVSEEGRAKIKAQVEYFKQHYDLIQSGLYDRITAPETEDGYTAWQFTAEDRSEALMNVVITRTYSNPAPIHVNFRSLDPDAMYKIEELKFFSNKNPQGQLMASNRERISMTCSGSALMYGGYTLPQIFGDYPSVQIYLKRV